MDMIGEMLSEALPWNGRASSFPTLDLTDRPHEALNL